MVTVWWTNRAIINKQSVIRLQKRKKQLEKILLDIGTSYGEMLLKSYSEQGQSSHMTRFAAMPPLAPLFPAAAMVTSSILGHTFLT